MGIAVMSQLLICASRVTDFKINQTDPKNIPLLKHPESFRTTLVQIANESYEAFAKAHNNMEKIQLQMGQVPDYAKDCARYMNSENKEMMKKLLRRRLERIKEAADDGATLSKEVCDTFDKLGQLIRQVLSASSLSMGEKEKEIKDKIEEVKEREEAAKKEQHKKLQERLEEQQRAANRNGEYLDETRKGKWNFWLQLIGCESKDKSLVYAQQMKEEAENKLKEMKKEAEQVQEQLDKITRENIASLGEMRVDVKKAFNQNETLQILREGLKYLGQLQGKWANMNRYFDSVRNYYTTVTFKALTDLLADAKDAQGGDPDMIEEFKISLQKSLGSCIKTQHSAKMYVKVSNNHIMKSINLMHGMLALPTNEIEEAQNKLVASCEAAANGIKDMYNEDMSNTIREIQILANPQNS
jgi:DNA repair exonuclease SbcCD ATPase subunit